MFKVAIEIDATIAAAVQQTGLPADLTLREIDSAAASADDSALLLGFVLPVSAANHANGSIEHLRARLPDYLRSDGVFFVSKGSPAALPDWCFKRLCLVTEHLLLEYTRSHLALARLRQREHQLEGALSVAEAAFVDFRREPLKLAWRMEPSGVYVRPMADGAGRASQELVVRQTVATGLANVNYVDLYFNRDGGGLSGEGRVTVTSRYSSKRICDRRFALAEVRPGWMRFACAPEDLVTREHLVIEVSLAADGPIDLVPGLSAASPIAEDCATLAGASVGRPLAVQIWCGIAGLRYPAHVNALADTDRIAPAVRLMSVPADVMAKVAGYSAAAPGVGFATVTYESESQSMLVHPLGRLPTVARLAGLRVRDLQSVSALVQLRRADARPTEFALLVVSAAAPPPPVEELQEGTYGDMAWLRLQGGELGEVRYAPAEPLTGEVDIYLMTRNTSEDYNFCWAFFRGLQLVCEAEPPA